MAIKMLMVEDSWFTSDREVLGKPVFVGVDKNKDIVIQTNHCSTEIVFGIED